MGRDEFTTSTLQRSVMFHNLHVFLSLQCESFEFCPSGSYTSACPSVLETDLFSSLLISCRDLIYHVFKPSVSVAFPVVYPWSLCRYWLLSLKSILKIELSRPHSYCNEPTLMLSWALYCLIVPQTSLTVRILEARTEASLSRGHRCNKCLQWAGYSSSAYLPPSHPNAGVSGNMDYSRYKREPVHHQGEFQQFWVIWCSSSSSTYGPGPAQTSTPRQPSGIQIPADYLSKH